jgi:negative regulator of sigma E activity
MNDASRLLDGDLTDAELADCLARLKSDPALRDELSTQQLLRDAVAGLRSPDDGYTQRILARLNRARGGAG